MPRGLFWNVQAAKKKAREREELANALRSAYEPGADIPYEEDVGFETGAVPGFEAEPEGLIAGQEPGQVNIQNALAQMYQGPGDQPVRALELQQALQKQQATSATANKLPSAVQVYQFRASLSPEQQTVFDDTLRQNYQPVTIGGVQHIVRKGQVPQTTALGTLAGETGAREQLAAAQKEGSALGTARTELAEAEASLPRLESVVKQLSELGKKATYTQAGQLTDIARRQAGIEPREAAVARREYIAKVDNEVLPLLRQTFGAAFTEREGQSLKATLGDVDASPEEKDAVLRSFINSKRAQIEVKRRRAGVDISPGEQYKVGQVVSGPDGRKYVIRSLKQDGTPDDVEPAQ